MASEERQRSVSVYVLCKRACMNNPIIPSSPLRWEPAHRPSDQVRHGPSVSLVSPPLDVPGTPAKVLIAQCDNSRYSPNRP